jgi:hypothetical protein
MKKKVKLEAYSTIFAVLVDNPGRYACLDSLWPVDATPKELSDDWIRNYDGETGHYYELCLEQIDFGPVVLPGLTSKQAQEVAEHAYHSGADVKIAAMVCAAFGLDAMEEYADTQNMYSMPGAPEIPYHQLKWVGSGFTIPE